MTSAWDIAWIGWWLTVLGWFLSPVISFLINKILSYTRIDASKKLRELEYQKIPELKLLLHAAVEHRVLGEARKDRCEEYKPIPESIERDLRSALYDAEDILDLIDYHKIEKKIFGDGERHSSSWVERHYGVVGTYIDRCKSWLGRCGSGTILQVPLVQRLGSWFASLYSNSESRLRLVLVQKLSSLFSYISSCRLGRCVHDIWHRSATLLPVSCAPSVPLVHRRRSWFVSSHSDSGWDSRLVLVGRFSSWFGYFGSSCRSMLLWLANGIEVARSYRDRSFDVVGITSYKEDDFLPSISRRNLKEQIEKIENTISETWKSPLLKRKIRKLKISNVPNDTSDLRRSSIGSTTIWKVFGRDNERNTICNMLREEADCGTHKCFSVVGICGIAGSGKTTLAKYVIDHEKDANDKYFDPIMCIHVPETFRVDDILCDMLKEIVSAETFRVDDILLDMLKEKFRVDDILLDKLKKIMRGRNSNITDCGELEEMLKKLLKGKRFLLVLDDIWTENQLELEKIFAPLLGGERGSKILVTSRSKDAARSLCATRIIDIANLDEHQYLEMFMHYACNNSQQYYEVGRKIARKLHKSPIAAEQVGRQLRGIHINEWRSIANLDLLNDTMGALFWSYQQLPSDVRQCFAYCSIFPKRYELKRDELVHMWIAQGFVKGTKEDVEDIGQRYFFKLLSLSFLQHSMNGTEYFTMHDLLHDLAEEVTTGDYLRIMNERVEDIPGSVHHIFVLACDGSEIPQKIYELENLHTLIVYTDAWLDIEYIFRRLKKLRVLRIKTSGPCSPAKGNLLSIPWALSSGQLKHMRYLALLVPREYKLALRIDFTKLYHLQTLDLGKRDTMSFSCVKSMLNLVNLRHVLTEGALYFPNVGKLKSLQTMTCFNAGKLPGYELWQLQHLNKLRGELKIRGLSNIESKKKALEAKLGDKERLTKLVLQWSIASTCNPGVEAEVLEGLCPPTGLDSLEISYYHGSRYPDWMTGESGGPKNLQELWLVNCSQLAPAPELISHFKHLRLFSIKGCSWTTLPDNMEQLTLLEILMIYECRNMRLLPRLPRSLKDFRVVTCGDNFARSCQTIGQPNYQKIEHIPKKLFLRYPGGPNVPA